jgi:hypothetical protein
MSAARQASAMVGAAELPAGCSGNTDARADDGVVVLHDSPVPLLIERPMIGSLARM